MLTPRPQTHPIRTHSKLTSQKTPAQNSRLFSSSQCTLVRHEAFLQQASTPPCQSFSACTTSGQQKHIPSGCTFAVGAHQSLTHHLRPAYTQLTTKTQAHEPRRPNASRGADNKRNRSRALPRSHLFTFRRSRTTNRKAATYHLLLPSTLLAGEGHLLIQSPILGIQWAPAQLLEAHVTVCSCRCSAHNLRPLTCVWVLKHTQAILAAAQYGHKQVVERWQYQGLHLQHKQAHSSKPM